MSDEDFDRFCEDVFNPGVESLIWHGVTYSLVDGVWTPPIPDDLREMLKSVEEATGQSK